MRGFGKRRRETGGRLRRAWGPLGLVLGIGITAAYLPATSLWEQRRLQRARDAAAALPGDALRAVAPHFVLGFHDFEQAAFFAEELGVGGLYITARNAANRSSEELRREIARLQKRRAAMGLPPLFIAADQEGGLVSRLTPPLEQPRALRTVAAGDAMTRRHRVVAHARRKAQALRSIGVTLNLSPVVDLLPAAGDRSFDRNTKLVERAISQDAIVVAETARWYSQTLFHNGVLPTLKHFPGLSRVRVDTHHDAGVVVSAARELEQSDWVPFRYVLRHTPAAVMMGHVEVRALDPGRLAPFSPIIIEGLIRARWGHQGLIITDDLSMVPASTGPWDGAGSAVATLNAGSDLALFSRIPADALEALVAAARAWQRGQLDRARLSASKERLSNALEVLYPEEAERLRAGLSVRRRRPAGVVGG